MLYACSNVSKKMNPLVSDKVDDLLHAVNLKLTQTEDSSDPYLRDRNVRTKTLTPDPPQDPIQVQTRDCSKLTIEGGRPIIPTSELGPASTMTASSLAKAALWLDLPKKTQAGCHEVPHVHTAQLDHWHEFQHYWQWGNRGKFGREQGFVIFLAAYRQDWFDDGHTEAVADKAAFKSHAQLVWEYEQPRYAESHVDSEDFAAFALAAKNRLASHGFTRSFRLSPDPREQDMWTTWVEYLNFIYWEMERDSLRMKKAEPWYRRAMEELMRIPSPQEMLLMPGWKEPVKTNDSVELQLQLEAAKEALENQFKRFNKVSRDAGVYLKYEKFVLRGRARAEWVLDTLAQIERGDSGDEASENKSKGEANEASKKGSMTKANDSINGGLGDGRLLGKRKNRHDDEEEKDKSTGNTLENGEPVASRLKRSRRRGETSMPASSAPAKEMSELLPTSTVRRSRRRQKDIGGDAAGSSPRRVTKARKPG